QMREEMQLDRIIALFSCAAKTLSSPPLPPTPAEASIFCQVLKPFQKHRRERLETPLFLPGRSKFAGRENPFLLKSLVFQYVVSVLRDNLILRIALQCFQGDHGLWREKPLSNDWKPGGNAIKQELSGFESSFRCSACELTGGEPM